jgi:hypothetical protein
MDKEKYIQKALKDNVQLIYLSPVKNVEKILESQIKKAKNIEGNAWLVHMR